MGRSKSYTVAIIAQHNLIYLVFDEKDLIKYNLCWLMIYSIFQLFSLQTAFKFYNIKSHELDTLYLSNVIEVFVITKENYLFCLIVIFYKVWKFK